MASPLRLPRIRAKEATSIASSVASLPYRGVNASVSSLFASTATPTGSRSVSPSGQGTPSRMGSSSIFGGTPGEVRLNAPVDIPDDPRNLIMQAFVPHVAVHTSVDTHELVKEKGFNGGLWELLRPFGERIQGKVTVRDSIGAGRTWEDFGVRFVQLGDGLEVQDTGAVRRSSEGRETSPNGRKVPDQVAAQRARTGGDIAAVEQLVDRHLSHAEDYPTFTGEDYLNFKDAGLRSPNRPSPFFTLYLRRLLSGLPLAPHETFSHPVACVIAISSRNKSPIETLRRLYDESNHGDRRLPVWVSSEYLRYYVLVHDEEKDDITKSMTLFDQMKRHFGLHCHLLRLRSSLCAASDDDSVQLPRPEWLSAREEVQDIQEKEMLEDVEDSFTNIYESDTTAIRTFIREMVTQSIIPSMERNVATWNDQVASRRRGISGRFMSLSKKWTGFGSSSRTSSGASSNGSSNYDTMLGFYRPDTPEALMRKLADYAFMLRDWKLAQSTYELLRSDFNNDKAWKYHAAANEMAALSTLLIPQSMSSKTRAETIDQMLETSSYSYSTRCGSPYGTLRCLLLGMELLRLRGGSATEDAARWGSRILETNTVGLVGNALIKERIAACYASKRGSGSGNWGARTRKSALWTILAADAWLTLGKAQQSRMQLEDLQAKHSSLAYPDSLEHFIGAAEFLQGLKREVQLQLDPASGIEGLDVDDLIESSVEESQAFEQKRNRRSVMSTAPPQLGESETVVYRGDFVSDDKEKPESLLQFE